MIRTTLTISVGLLIALGAVRLEAAAVTTLTPTNGDSAHGPSDSNGTVDTGSLAVNANDIPGQPTTGTASWSTTALAKHRAFEVVVSMFGALGTFHDSETRIDFTITLTNSVGTAAADPDQDAALGDDIGPIDLAILTPSPGSIEFTSGVTPTGTVGGVTYSGTRISGILLRIGGLNGGGFQIPHGDSGTLNFSVSGITAIGSGSFTLSTTANPEPTSLALAGLGICLFGGGGYLRRRKRLQQSASTPE